MLQGGLSYESLAGVYCPGDFSQRSLGSTNWTIALELLIWHPYIHIGAIHLPLLLLFVIFLLRLADALVCVDIKDTKGYSRHNKA